MTGSTPDDPSGHDSSLHVTLEHPDLQVDLECASASSAAVLITADGPVAAELATHIHRTGAGRTGPFVSLDCDRAHSVDQIDRAFSAAAPRGTVFLPNVQQLPPALQDALRGRITPLSVRVIAASTTNLLDAVIAGRFDEALFYRLNQIHLRATATLRPDLRP
jgi:DNA-binding NtrC family response regulator